MEKITAIVTIGKSHNLMIEEVLLVDGLKHDLLSISQSCDKYNNAPFDSFRYKVIKSKSNQTIFTNLRSGNTYTVLNKISSNDVCLLNNKDES